MAIQWGSWEYGGGNGMRVGIEVSRTSVSHSSASCTVTFKVYTQNQYSYSDDQTLAISGTTNWANVSYHNGSGGGSVLRATKSYKYTFDSNDYGSGTAKTVTMSVSLSGAYNGVTPSKSVSLNIPKRPYDNAHAATWSNAARVSDSQVNLAWNITATAGEPISGVYLDRWDNVSNVYSRVGLLGAVESYSNTGLATNRRYRWRVLPTGAGGNATSWAYSEYVQTTPSAPMSCSVSKSSIDSVLVSWVNGASSSNYSYDTLLEEQVDGGAWTAIATLAAGTSSYNRTGCAPGSVYAYRVRHRSSVDVTTYSAYSTSDTIQLQSPPAAPTVVSTVRINDNSFTLNWTNNPDGELAPYDSLIVQRWDSASNAWGTIASLGATATSLTDTGTIVNRAYQWRIAAINLAGQSEWATFATYQTRPADPSEVKAKAAPGGAIRVTWINNVSYGSYTTKLRYYKNDVLVTDTISIAAGETSYLLEGVDLAATYIFGVKATSNVGYASESAWVDGASMAAATVPNAPAGLVPNGQVVDLALDQTITWVHNPSLDDSDQTAYEIQYSTDDGSTWTTTGKVVAAASAHVLTAGTLPNGMTITWQARTWGVHADPSPWSANAVFTSSATPTVTINQPIGGTVNVSRLDVAWTYGDAESTPQASWELELYDDALALLEAQSGQGETFSATMTTVIVDGNSYVLRLRVEDGDGLRSNWVERNLQAQFTPPALPDLTADYSQESGVTIVTLTPTPDDGGVTTLPTTVVDVQRRLLRPETGAWDEWVTLAEGVTPDSTLIDTTSPIARDGEYRIVAHSAAPSAKVSAPQPPSGFDDRWVYVSGGKNFTRVCRLMGNVAIRTTTSRDRALYDFAGRNRPVMFTGEVTNRVIDVAGLLDAESSTPAEWEFLIESSDVMLFRDPLGHRVFGSIPQVTIDNLGNEEFAISFSVTEVAYP